MGENIINLYKTKCRKEWKIAFISTLVIGLFVHIYKFTNYLPNHDSMYNFYSDQNVLGSGRWFLSIACGLSSYFDLPWINGTFALIYIAITSVIIIELFEVKNTVPIILISGLLVSFPAVTETFFFEFTADGYMLAMLLSAVAVYIIRLENNKFRNVIFSAVLLSLSCGIYQAYVSFAMVLMILYFIWKLLDNKDDNFRTYSKWIRNQLIAVISGMILFFIIWKLCMYFQNVSANDYQGINNLGLNLDTIMSGIKSTFLSLINFLVEGNVLKHGINIYGVLNILMIIAFISIIIYSFLKNREKMNAIKILVIAGCIIGIPFIICIWCFTSKEVGYAARMLQSYVLIYIFSILLCDKYVKVKYSNLFALLVSITVINFSIMANIAYYYLDNECKNSMVEAIEMKNEIDESIEKVGSNYELAIIGDRLTNVALDFDTEAKKVRLFTNMIEKSLLYNAEHIIPYFNNVLYYSPNTASYDKIEEIAKRKEFSSMETWDNSKKVYILSNHYIVMKLS